ncbi:hypothetical protein [Streptomyces sp. H39-C1]|uniref:hypothetical protein n=1 Tax=Streptomyces sp. H39-C1 TaxID=3004355 RepID=UPI0022AF4CCD|nr:hypothetical protein [Streptomyces sp. H39-C1]MCZ4103527.1 hypothetical protein [Streptomyces sp. H39-C1]
MAYWQTLYPGTGLPGWPPLAFVFTGAGPKALANRMQTLADLTREHWAAQKYWFSEDDDGFLDFTGTVPLVLTTLERLQQHGLHGPSFRRVAQGRGEFEPLLQALTDTHTKAAYWQRERPRRAAAEARREAERAAQRAALQQQWDEDDQDDQDEQQEEVQCATPDCSIPVNEPADPYAEEMGVAVPPEDGVSCWSCRQNQAARNRGLRGALRGLRRQRDSSCPVPSNLDGRWFRKSEVGRGRRLRTRP